MATKGARVGLAADDVSVKANIVSELKERFEKIQSRIGREVLVEQSQAPALGKSRESTRAVFRLRYDSSEQKDVVAEEIAQTLTDYTSWEIWHHCCRNDERKRCEPWVVLRRGP